MGRKELSIGILLTLSFFALLATMVSPIFNGKNFLAYADEQFDSYSKHSSYFIPEIRKEVDKFTSPINVEIAHKDASKIAKLYGPYAEVKDGKVVINGNLNEIIKLALVDADRGYHNDDKYFEEKYGMSLKETLYLWHVSLSAIAKDLEKKERFEESLFIKIQVLMRAIEPAYNFYGYEAKPIDIIGAGLLVFYVIYTVWWGFAIYFMFEGFGIKVTKAKAKKEV